MSSRITSRLAWVGLLLWASLAAAAANWSKAISLESAGSDHGWVADPGTTDTVRFGLRNTAAAPAAGTAVWTLLDLTGRTVRSEKTAAPLPAGATTVLAWSVPTTGLPTGEYAVRLSYEVDGNRALGIERSLMVPGPEDLFILCDKTPVARGLEIVPNRVEPREVEVDGFKRWVWCCLGGTAPQGWWHSMLLNVTDPRFRNGGRPVVDVTLNFHHTPNAPVQLMADTERGGVQIGSGWGMTPRWQTMTVELDDAAFARKRHGYDPVEMKTDGCDLRFNACNVDGELRSLLIRGYDLDTNPDYSRLLRYEGIDAGREMFLFAPGEKANLGLKLRNLARKPLEASADLTLTDDLDREQWHRVTPFTVPARSAVAVPIAFDTQGLPQKDYQLRSRLSRKVAAGSLEFLNTHTWLMVGDPGKPGPATPPADEAFRIGRFLYGLDSGLEFRETAYVPWMQFMGAELLRNVGSGNLDEAPEALAFYAQHGLQCSLSVDPPWDPDPKRLIERTAQVAAKAGEIARRCSSQLFYYELGNEPDLPFFYGGPMASYVKGFEAIGRAIKQADPSSVVMNGGLCFAGPEADRRAREFLELVPTESIDRIAYHGHGPGAAAERAAYERTYAAAQKHDKAGKGFFETESGVSAGTTAQLRVQARTAVQKMVYAQSVGLPSFFWFRLHITGGDGDYTNLKNVHEPRPVILSYHAMTQNLKGLRYISQLDLGDGLAGYCFAEPTGDRRALVAWAEGRAGGNRRITIGSAAGQVSDIALVDLFGNTTAQPAGNEHTVTIGPDPVYLTWHSHEAAFKPTVAAPLISAGAALHLVPGRREQVAVTVRNPLPAATQAQLVVEPVGDTPVKAAVATVPVSLPAAGQATVTLDLSGAGRGSALRWPQGWTVFTGMPTDSVDVQAIRAMPTKLEAKGQALLPQQLLLRGGKLDLASVAGGYKEKSEAIGFAQVQSDRDQTVTLGASADWWMAWFVNGQPVFDTLQTGNAGGYQVTDHLFQAPLKAGRNLLAVRVLSGSQGFKLFCGGPDEVDATQRQARGTLDQVKLSLRAGGKVLGEELVTVAWSHVLQAPPADWNTADPDGELGSETVLNPWAAQPDSSRWWKGASDLSGRVWVRADAQWLYVTAAVRDDHNRPGNPDTGDALRVSLLTATGLRELGVTGTTVLRRVNEAWQPVPAADAVATTERVESLDVAGGGTTWYRLRVARRLLGTGHVAVNAEAVDNDWGELKQRAPWSSGKAEMWWEAALP